MITAFVRKIFNGRDNSHNLKPERILKQPGETAEKELGRFLFDLCVNNAVKFVTDEFSRPESPFREVREHKLFHELLAINFWLVDRKFSKTAGSLIDEIHNLYCLSYGGAAEFSAPTGPLKDRYAAYHASWDDYTGYYDKFGTKATEFIFEDAGAVPVEQTSFWIITHAHDANRTFSGVKKKYRAMIR